MLLEGGVVGIEFFGDLLLDKKGFGFDLRGDSFEEVVLLQEQPHQLKLIGLHRQDIKLHVIHGIVDVESELFKVARDHIDALGLVVFVVEGLITDFVQVLGIGSLEFDDGECLAVLEDGPVGLFGVLDVFEFRSQVVIRLGIDRIAEDFDK